jgi:hypothetical protein
MTGEEARLRRLLLELIDAVRCSPVADARRKARATLRLIDPPAAESKGGPSAAFLRAEARAGLIHRGS